MSIDDGSATVATPDAPSPATATTTTAHHEDAPHRAAAWSNLRATRRAEFVEGDVGEVITFDEETIQMTYLSGTPRMHNKVREPPPRREVDLCPSRTRRRVGLADALAPTIARALRRRDDERARDDERPRDAAAAAAADTAAGHIRDDESDTASEGESDAAADGDDADDGGIARVAASRLAGTREFERRFGAPQRPCVLTGCAAAAAWPPGAARWSPEALVAAWGVTRRFAMADGGDDPDGGGGGGALTVGLGDFAA
jgi:hypothetical protein